jgi:hypothetical protein
VDAVSDLTTFILELLLVAPFAGPYQAVEGGTEPACGWWYAPAPFARGTAGYLEPAACPSEGVPERKVVAGQAAVEGLGALDGTYGRVQARARFLTVYRFEVDAAYGDYFATAHDPPAGWLGQTHLDVRFAQSERVAFRAGAGVRDRFVDGKAFVGFDALYGVDVFWPRGLSTTLEVTGGTLGENGWAAEVRGTSGYVFGPLEPYVGWDAVWLGAPRQRTASLGGPVLGVRAYF